MLLSAAATSGQSVAIGLAAIVVLGISAQWFAWRLKIPSILLLLVFGFIAGPVLGYIHPDELFGDLLFPFVSLSVAIILFEGGLSLKMDELGGVESVVRLLITLGALVSWAVVSLAGIFILNLDVLLAVLLGAVLVVTGPTVVIPLLKQIRPIARVSSVLKWEGILIDPVGATLAVLVFEAILDGASGPLTLWNIVSGIIITLLIGTVIGSGFALVIVQLMKRNWIAPFLETAMVVMAVVAAFTLSNGLRAEAGLMAVTIMGIILINQKQVNIGHIVHFKEELVVLLLSVLFIVLAARVELDAFLQIDWRDFAFLLIVILVARPLSVIASSLGSNLPWKERLFVSSMAPRGIVAVSVASLFAIELHEAGFSDSDELVNMTFFVVVGTVLVYGLLSRPLARILNLTEKEPQGTLIVGAHNWAREIAGAIQEAGFEVWLVDNNKLHVEQAREERLNAIHEDIMSDGIIEEVPVERLGRLLAMTSNSELNALASLQFTEWVGSDNVFQLAPMRQSAKVISENLRGRLLFDEALHFDEFEKLHYQDAQVITLSAAEITALTDQLGDSSLLQPLFEVLDNGHLHVITSDIELSVQDEQPIICLVSSDVQQILSMPNDNQELEKEA